jgi:hypothetical protein
MSDPTPIGQVASTLDAGHGCRANGSPRWLA